MAMWLRPAVVLIVGEPVPAGAFVGGHAREDLIMSNVDPTPEKPVEEWVTGDEPMTGPQRSYLETLAREAGEEVPDGLSKAQASQLIDRLQRATGRGSEPSTGPDRGHPGTSSSVDELVEHGIVDQQAAGAEPQHDTER
jgi:hypothetical protein